MVDFPLRGDPCPQCAAPLNSNPIAKDHPRVKVYTCSNCTIDNINADENPPHFCTKCECCMVCSSCFKDHNIKHCTECSEPLELLEKLGEEYEAIVFKCSRCHKRSYVQEGFLNYCENCNKAEFCAACIAEGIRKF